MVAVHMPERGLREKGMNYALKGAILFLVLGLTTIPVATNSMAQSVEADAEYTGNEIKCNITNNRDHPIRVRQIFYRYVCQSYNGLASVTRSRTVTCTSDCDVDANDSRDDIGPLYRTTDCNVVDQGCGIRIDNLPP
jgi:hypothetical protein